MKKPVLKLVLSLMCAASMYVASSVAQTCPSVPHSGAFLAFAMEPVLSGKTPEMLVDLSFRLPGVQSVDLQLPSEWEGQQNLYQAIHDIQALSAQTFVRETSPARRRLTFPSGQIVRLRYRVEQDWEGKLAAETYFRVILQPTFFQFSGRNFLVYPSFPEDQILPISFEWKNLPPGWAVASSLGNGPFCQTATTSLLKAADGLIVGGDFRLLEVRVHGKPVQVAIRGKWDFPDEAFTQLVGKVLGEERTFWNDFAVPHYLISLLPSEDTPGSYAGTALDDSFTMFMSQQAAELDFDMKFVLAHEMFHSWNPGKLGEIPPDDPPYWFVEGFTDYYARVLLLRAGLISFDEYMRDINSSYSHYRTSPVLAGNDQLVRERFYVDPDIQKLAYQRGSLLALTWDSRIRQRSQGKQSLDDAMLDLRRRASTTELILTATLLGDHFSRFAGNEVRNDVTAYIDKGTVIPLPPSALGPCVVVQEITAYPYDPGLDVEKMARTRVISGVKPGSEAEHAGVRNGQIVIERSGIRPGDPDQRISLTVRDNTGEKTVAYFPRGPAVNISQYVLDAKTAAAHQECHPAPRP